MLGPIRSIYVKPPALGRPKNDCNFTIWEILLRNSLVVTARQFLLKHMTFESFLSCIYDVYNSSTNIQTPIKAILYILICMKWGDWQNWRKYYSTILYVIVWDLLFYIITINHPLCTFSHPVLKHTFSDLLIALFHFPVQFFCIYPILFNNSFQSIKRNPYRSIIIIWMKPKLFFLINHCPVKPLQRHQGH